ncbi:MAG: dUTP diphosphatase [Methanococcaceae archaeon]
MNENIKLKIKRVSENYQDVPLPAYATVGSAGMDVRAAVEEDLILAKGEIKLVPTNLMAEIPEGFELQVRPRSGLAIKHGIGLLNSPGTIDSDYRGEIGIIMFNFGQAEFVIKRGDRIAQLVLARVFRAEISELQDLQDTDRGNGGFGSTGRD